jgi:isopentenyl diphosphate isomerase/L-lactate dehydrogenase-like FMN-dependent dehydrogenase
VRADGRASVAPREQEFVTLHEFVKAARMKLPPGIWDYLVGGAETETTLRRNRLALDSIAFRPRVLRDVSRVDPSGRVFGVRLRIPVVLAPIGGLQSFDAAGGAAVARAAAEFGTAMILSSASTPSLEETAAAAAGPKIYQLYVRGDDAWCADVVRRVADAGYEAFCLTVDTAHYSRRERDLAKRAILPWRRRDGDEFLASLTWDEVDRFRDQLTVPLILKGIATAEDAELACEHGVDAIYVSNHGGRQLDHGRGAIEVLPEVVAAVRGRAQVIVDGGFSRGSDVIKAIALGADAVGVGRLYCYALAAAGCDGIVRALEILEDEIVRSLALLGVTSFADLGPSFLHSAAPVGTPHVHSAFPLLNLEDPGYGGR